MSSSRTANAGAGTSGAVYGLGFLGALVWYWQNADGFWGHIGGVLEAIFWPAFLVYDLLSHLH